MPKPIERQGASCGNALLKAVGMNQENPSVKQPPPKPPHLESSMKPAR